MAIFETLDLCTKKLLVSALPKSRDEAGN